MRINKKYQIYCDMDGVLVDFMSAAIEQINKDLKDKSIVGKNIEKLRKDLIARGQKFITGRDLDKIDKKNRLRSARKYMYSRLTNNEEFWANLPWMPDGKELWEHISKYNPRILTTPLKDEASKKGKIRWIEKNLTPRPKEILMSHEKYKWATEDGRPNILIDDFNINTIPWDEHGGISILHVNTKDTIEELKRI